MPKRSTLALIALLLLITPGARSDDLAQTLRGLPGVMVELAISNPEWSENRLDSRVLQTDAELRLRKAGIAVLTREAWLKTAGMPFLQIRVNIIGKTDKAFWGRVQLDLYQDVALVRNSQITLSVSTWSTGIGMGEVPKDALEERARNRLADVMDQFINASLAVNPRPTGR